MLHLIILLSNVRFQNVYSLIVFGNSKSSINFIVKCAIEVNFINLFNLTTEDGRYIQQGNFLFLYWK
jgi:hypothetical protein